ncbi:unnamed protein product [Cylicocyclus nassatus]|uniref:beta-N-acetylhexosaminidase n=1 Tax=Cylicocyclus nassatus TaxID=53992 RepID=A0AA36DN25_CYLNA|nr:unnamed protein product [Cylicocyclus nassatus]
MQANCIGRLAFPHGGGTALERRWCCTGTLLDGAGTELWTQSKEKLARSLQPHGTMIWSRYLRRRGFGMVCRVFMGCTIVFITLQIANSFPSLSIRERKLAADVHASAQDGEANKYMHNKEPNLYKTGSGNHAQVVQKPNNSMNNYLHQGEVKDPQKNFMRPPRKSRKNEFYENIIVHFDLKGAPPRVPYFMELLDLVARAGATGILLEWEEMFPWKGRLAVARGADAYSLDDVRAILSRAKSLNLDIIPLVQTFGHLEWFLKLEEFRKYRENDAYPQVLCLGDQDGVAIVKEALKQVIDVHKEFGIKYFHIGADEAFEFGVCEKSRNWIMSKGKGADKQLLALTHLKDIAEYVRSQTDGATVLAWHDMLKEFDLRLIGSLGLGRIIEPVIWDYSEGIVTMPEQAFSALADNFPIVWASSAYKGANFPSAKYIDILHYETNNNDWIEAKRTYEGKFEKFHGIILAGWQRYDHMAAICETLPVGTPSMVLNVQVALLGRKDQHLARNRAAQILGCNQFHVGGLDPISQSCNFTGFQVYYLFQGSARSTIKYIESELDKSHSIKGWLSPYSMRYNFTQNWYLKDIKYLVQMLQMQIKSIEQALRRELSMLFFPNTVDEFIYLTISPTVDRLKKYEDEIERLLKIRSWPKRPFPIKT